MEWKIGCSGYHYPEWKGTFYPEDLQQRKWFEYYCTHFNTLELNVTYYKFPRLESLKRWNERSPDGFSFSIKAPILLPKFQYELVQKICDITGEHIQEYVKDAFFMKYKLTWITQPVSVNKYAKIYVENGIRKSDKYPPEHQQTASILHKETKM